MALGLPPINSALLVNGGLASWPTPWGNWLSQAFAILQASQQSGTTAQRPTTNLWPGRIYFDTSLGADGKPIWVNKTATGWVLADGTAA